MFFKAVLDFVIRADMLLQNNIVFQNKFAIMAGNLLYCVKNNILVIQSSIYCKINNTEIIELISSLLIFQLSFFYSPGPSKQYLPFLFKTQLGFLKELKNSVHILIVWSKS